VTKPVNLRAATRDHSKAKLVLAISSIRLVLVEQRDPRALPESDEIESMMQAPEER
jgi:hypothetical protein